MQRTTREGPLVPVPHGAAHQNCAAAADDEARDEAFDARAPSQG